MRFGLFPTNQLLTFMNLLCNVMIHLCVLECSNTRSIYCHWLTVKKENVIGTFSSNVAVEIYILIILYKLNSKHGFMIFTV